MKKLAGLLAIPVLVACGAGAGSPVASERPIPSQATQPSGGSDGLPAGMLDEVIALAEQDTGVDRSEIEGVLAEAVTWSDGSIGCPEVGMMYTQALVPGYRVILDIAGEEVHYHAGSDGQFFPCGDPQPAAEGRTGDS